MAIGTEFPVQQLHQIMLNFALQPTSALSHYLRIAQITRFGPKAKTVAVVRRPSVDTLVDGCHGGYDNENDRYERT